MGIRLVIFKEGRWIDLTVVTSSIKHDLELVEGSNLLKTTIPEGWQFARKKIRPKHWLILSETVSKHLS